MNPLCIGQYPIRSRIYRQGQIKHLSQTAPAERSECTLEASLSGNKYSVSIDLLFQQAASTLQKKLPKLTSPSPRPGFVFSPGRLAAGKAVNIQQNKLIRTQTKARWRRSGASAALYKRANYLTRTIMRLFATALAVRQSVLAKRRNGDRMRRLPDMASYRLLFPDW